MFSSNVYRIYLNHRCLKAVRGYLLHRKWGKPSFLTWFPKLGRESMSCRLWKAFTTHQYSLLSLGIRVRPWSGSSKPFPPYLTQLGLGCTVLLNQVLKLIVDVLFSAANLLQSSTNFILEFVQISLEIPWDFSR